MKAKTKPANVHNLPVVVTDPDAFALPGAILVLDPDEADELGACLETALGPEEAWESNSDEGKGE